MMFKLMCEVHYVLHIDNTYCGQEPFVNIPDDTIREALKVVLGITNSRTSLL